MRWARSLASGVGLTLLAPLGCDPRAPARVPLPERAFASEADTPAADAATAAPDDQAGAVKAPPRGAAALESARRIEREPAGEAPDDDDPPRDPSLPLGSYYGGLGRARCEAELHRRGISFEPLDDVHGVVAPLRLTGPLSGVTFRSNLPPNRARTSPYDIYDCRLVLALDDFARVLVKYDIVEVVHFSVYRPARGKRAQSDAPGRAHPGALAIDAARFKTADGRTLSVLKDFRGGRRGSKPCPAPSSASDLRKIACEAHEAGLFNVLLTPHYDRAHKDHLHLEVRGGVPWTLVR